MIKDALVIVVMLGSMAGIFIISYSMGFDEGSYYQQTHDSRALLNCNKMISEAK